MVTICVIQQRPGLMRNIFFCSFYPSDGVLHCSGDNLNNELINFEGVGANGGPYQTFLCPVGTIVTGFEVTAICYGKISCCAWYIYSQFRLHHMPASHTYESSK